MLDSLHSSPMAVSIGQMRRGPAVRYSEFAVSHPKPPPLVGQHTVEILKGMLGYDNDAIEELLRTGVVAQHECFPLCYVDSQMPKGMIRDIILSHLQCLLQMFPHTWDIPAQLSAMCALELMFKSRSFLISGQEERYPLAEAHQPQQLSSLCAKASEAMFM
ncbi:hypothetical protein Q9233_013379 [Columba guinea]|nr:hypothetical protein Q9233_013379 [Columba guinea]